MKNVIFPVVSALLLMTGALLPTGDAYAACHTGKVHLTINRHGLWVKPDGEPKCLGVADPSDVEVQFSIKLNTPGTYELRDGQVHVRQAIAKEEDGVSLPCSTDLSFEDNEYTNTGEDDIVVTVLGEDVSIGDVICYEIVVDDIGMLDPRAEVDDQDAVRGFQTFDIRELINAFDILADSGLTYSLMDVDLGEFIASNYGITEEEANNMINADYSEAD